MTVPHVPDAPPLEFRQAVASLRLDERRPDRQRAGISLHEIPGPKRVAPFSYALTADLVSDDDELADGRLVVLYDPAGQPGWEGRLRLVSFVRASVELEMAVDPLLTSVGWTWLVDSLHAHEATHAALAGAVTRTASARFGETTEEPDTAEIEIRASWTPLDDDLGRHLDAWCDVLRAVAGLPPTGVTTLHPR